MTAVALDRFYSSGAVIFDRFADIAGLPTITSVPTVQDGAAITFAATGLDASGNTAWMAQDDLLVQLQTDTESTTSLVTTALDTSGFKLALPATLYLQNSTGVQSNSVVVTLLPKANEAAYLVTQQFIGSSVNRISSKTDLSFLDEVRFKNPTGSGMTIANLFMKPQGDLVVHPSLLSVQVAIQDGTGLGAYDTVFFADPTTTVTTVEVRGQLPAAAATLEAAVGLVVEQVGFTQSLIYAVGTVAVQFPSAGVSQSIGDTVEITLSLGATGVLAPSLVGVPLALADASRTAAGLIGSDNRYIDGLNSGLVIGQSTRAGQIMQVGDTLDLTYSTNLCPNFKGGNFNAAAAAIAAAGLTLDSNIPTRITVVDAPGTVVDQSPAPDTPVNAGDTITLTLAMLPDLVVSVATGGSPMALTLGSTGLGIG